MAKKGKHFRALEEAKAAGYTVTATIALYPKPFDYRGEYNVLPIHGVTRVALTRGCSLVASSKALCSVKDGFDPAMGLQIACGRALKQAQGR